MIIPSRISRYSNLAVVSPARSLAIIEKDTRNIASNRLDAFNIKIIYGRNSEIIDTFNSSPIQERLEDIHQAFYDKSIRGILSTIGGFNSNQLLDNIDYNLIKKNPKVICGFSDITAILNAIYKKTGLITYYGPHFSSFGMKRGFNYTLKNWVKCVMQNSDFKIEASPTWSNDAWYRNQSVRTFFRNEGPWILNKGEAEGEILGGNLCTINLLQGTSYMPNYSNKIVFVEDDLDTNADKFDRDLQSLLHCSGRIKALLIGRFEINSGISKNILIEIIQSKKMLQKIPVVGNLNFGHTTPIATIPIGGHSKIIANHKFSWTITTH